ncbi:MAG: hypothetical protein IKA56_05700, partial [Clostridia bacterium]|nr:hypothetical protein [Clostridia bacterium]
CDEKNEIQMVMFDKHYLDGYSICKGDFDGGELAYFYKEGVLFKFEATTGNKLIKREYYDENGNATRVEVEDWLVYEYKYDNGNLVELICSDANGDISYKSKYEYDGFLLLKEITEIENNVSETIYNSEKMDNNTYKCTATDGSYIIFVIDDFGNMISNSSYEKEGNLITKTECVWDKK